MNRYSFNHDHKKLVMVGQTYIHPNGRAFTIKERANNADKLYPSERGYWVTEPRDKNYSELYILNHCKRTNE